MIYLDIDGRAGNQFFRYSFAKKIQNMRNDDLLCVDFQRVKRHNFEDDLSVFLGDDFKIAMEQTYKKHFTFIQKTLIMLCRFFFHFIKNKKTLMKVQLALQPFLESHGIAYLELGYYNYTFNNFKGKNIYINGCFEDSRFIDASIRQKLVNEEFLRDENIYLYKLINEKNSVCVSVRRGDFLIPEHASYNICNEGYFREAFEVISKYIEDPLFIVFGDDLEWCSQFFSKWHYDFQFERAGCSIGEKILLMSSCKHYIISNSTFSWWAQYLSNFERKIVVSPSIWNKNEVWNGLIEKNFYTINVK